MTNSPAFIDELLATLSEAAVEIANLDDERNPVCRRLRAAMKLIEITAVESEREAVQS